MTWPMFAALAGGGLWTMFTLMMGFHLAKSTYSPPSDLRSLKNG